METLTKTSDDGRALHVSPDVTPLGYVLYEVTDADGKRIANGPLQDAIEHGVPTDKLRPGHTHLIPAYPAAIWFTPEEVTQLTRMGEQAAAAFHASEEGQQVARWRAAEDEKQRTLVQQTEPLHTPEGRALLAQRDELARAVEAQVHADTQQRERAHDDEGGDPGQYYRDQMPKNEAAIERARAALTAFDAEHPELVAALRAQKDDAINRALDH